MKNYFTPKEMGICDSMAWDQIDNLQDLIIHVLNPLREAYGKPIKINSGFRTPIHNKEVGGAPNSQHCEGIAADIDAGSKVENKKLYDIIVKKLPFDQCINESDYSWIHVSFTTTRPNRKSAFKLG